VSEPCREHDTGSGLSRPVPTRNRSGPLTPVPTRNLLAQQRRQPPATQFSSTHHDVMMTCDDWRLPPTDEYYHRPPNIILSLASPRLWLLLLLIITSNGRHQNNNQPRRGAPLSIERGLDDDIFYWQSTIDIDGWVRGDDGFCDNILRLLLLIINIERNVKRRRPPSVDDY